MKALAVLAGALLPFPPAQAQVSFVPLGFLDGYGPTSEAYAVDALGTKVVGYSTTSLTENQACAWTAAGIAPLPGAQNWLNNAAYGISADGSVVVGSNSWGGTEEAFYWTATTLTQYVPLPPAPPPATQIRASSSWDVSADGKVIVGGVTYVTSDGVNATRYPRSFRWSPGETTATLLPQLAGSFKSDTALAANHDGSLIVGTAFTSLTTQTGVYWLNGAGPFPLSRPGDVIQTISANAVTPDGSVIVGSAVNTATGKGVAFRWTAAGGTVGLPAPTTGYYAIDGTTCYSVSGDGRVVVGYGENVAGADEAIFWVDGAPFRVADLAYAIGVPTSWEPFRAYGCDYYGNLICGHGRATSGKIEGFVLYRDTTPAAPAIELPKVRTFAPAANGDFTIRYFTVPGLRYRVLGGSNLGSLSPLNGWADGAGFELPFTMTGGGPRYFLSVEVTTAP